MADLLWLLLNWALRAKGRPVVDVLVKASVVRGRRLHYYIQEKP